MYKANKPCRFGGRQFFVGDAIPEELIAEERKKTLVKYGTIAYFEDAPQEVAESAKKPVEAEGDTKTRANAENAQNGVESGLIGTPAAKKNAPAKKPPEKKGGK